MYVKRGHDSVGKRSVDACHDGEGTVFVRQLLGEPGDFDSSMSFMHETTLPPGTTIGEHLHEGNEELYYIIDGRGEMNVDGKTIMMSPGDVCLTKTGSTHQLTNVGDTDLRIVVVEAKN